MAIRWSKGLWTGLFIEVKRGQKLWERVCGVF